MKIKNVFIFTKKWLQKIINSFKKVGLKDTIWKVASLKTDFISKV